MGRYLAGIAVGIAVFLAATPVSAIWASSKRETASQLVLRGVDSQKHRPFTLRSDSLVTWVCPGCADSNFIFSTDEDGVVNALGPTRGKSFLERGRYTGVDVLASGRYTITISPLAQPFLIQGSSKLVLRGEDGQNVRPLVIKRDSNLVWSCTGCRGDNFIFGSDQDGWVNALGPTRGRSFVEQGRYTGVDVIAGGPWTITIG